MKNKKLEELKKSAWYKEQEKLAKEFKLSVEDIHNLFDLFFMVDNPPEIQIDFRETLKLNKMDKWFYKFHERIEEIALSELKEKKNERPRETKD